MNLFGDPLDGLGPIDTKDKSEIYKEALLIRKLKK